MVPFGKLFFISSLVPIILSASASRTKGLSHSSSNSSRALIELCLVSIPGPIPMASKFSKSGYSVKIISERSILTIDSGTAVCIISYPKRGICVLNNPTPDRKHALEAKIAAPIFP